MKRLLQAFGWALLLACGLAGAQTKQGAITAINSAAAAACSSASCVVVDMHGKGAVTVQVTGTYTAAGGLSGQITTDGSTWVTLAASTTFTRLTTGVSTATITSGQQDIYQVSAATGAVAFRVTALGAVTGTATVSIEASDISLGGGGAAGAAGATTVADGANIVEGATTDSASGADTAGTINAHLRELTKSNTQLPAALLTNGDLPVGAAIRTDYIGLAAANVVPKFAKITASSSGNNAIVAAVSSKKIRVVAYALSPNAAVNAKWQSDGAGTPVDLTGLIYMTAQGNGIAGGFNPVGYFESASGKSLDLNLSGAVAVGGYLVYVEI